MHTHIQKWGNSLGLRIFVQFAKQLKINPGSVITIEIEDGRLIIQSPKYDLDIMLKDITKENQHHQILENEQHGNEEW